MMSSGPSDKSKGRPLSDIWNTHMIQGSRQSRGYYSATCSYCQQFWKQWRPQVLWAHLANHCKKCPDNVSLYYAKIVRKKLGQKEEEEEEEEEEESTDDESVYLNKKQRTQQMGIKSFFGRKVEKGLIDEYN